MVDVQTDPASICHVATGKEGDTNLVDGKVSSCDFSAQPSFLKAGLALEIHGFAPAPLSCLFFFCFREWCFFWRTVSRCVLRSIVRFICSSFWRRGATFRTTASYVCADAPPLTTLFLFGPGPTGGLLGGRGRPHPGPDAHVPPGRPLLDVRLSPRLLIPVPLL